MGTADSITLKNTTIHGINIAMDRRNIQIQKSCGSNQYSSIPTFHVSWTRPEYEKQSYFQ